MAFEIRCDVEGCDSLAPVSNYSPLQSPPLGWAMVILQAPTSDLDLQKRKNRFADLVGGGSLSGQFVPLGMLPGAETMPRKAYVCSKHELPKFKPAEPMPNDIDFVVG